MDDMESMTNWEELGRLLEQAEQVGASRTIDEAQMSTALKGRVVGQDHVVDDLCRYLRLQWAKQERTRPLASFLFVGPTGTGKTELAKAVASYLYDDEKNMLLFDCADFSGPEAKNRLIGVPKGYQGWESGGQLTRQVRNNPRRVILFDEVEKAWAGIFDLFLSMLGDGRLTEASSGQEADFTQAIVVLTSNAEAEAIAKIDEQITDPQEKTNAIKQHLRDSKVFRAEILGRFDRIYVFKPLSGNVMARIAILKMNALARQYGLELAYVAPQLVFEAMQKSNKIKEFGVRELDRIIGEILGDAMYEAKRNNIKRIKLCLNADGVLQVDPA